MRLALAAGVLAAVSACDLAINTDLAGVVVREEKEFTVSGVPDVTLATFDGAVEVRAWDRASIHVEIEKRANDKTAADRLEVRSRQTGNVVSVEVVEPAGVHGTIGFSRSPSAKLIASVPRQCNLVVKSGDGSVTVERVTGKLDFDSGDGSIHGSDLGGALRAHTGDGSMKVEGMNGTVDLDTNDGSVVARGKLEGVRIRTTDGSVTLRADPGSAMASDWDIRTGDGSVTLEVPEAFSADLNAVTGGGGIHVEGLSGDVNGETSRRSVKGRIGTGGHELRVVTGDGPITIRKG